MRTLSVKRDNLSAPKEDYIRAISLLQEKAPTEKVSVTQIADRLDLGKSTVSERMRDLVADGLVVMAPYADIKLTPKGQEIAKQLTYKHRLIEVFLNQTLKMPIDAVHREAEQLEHALSDEVAKRLAKFLNYPTTDPHGTVISKPMNW